MVVAVAVSRERLTAIMTAKATATTPTIAIATLRSRALDTGPSKSCGPRDGNECRLNPDRSFYVEVVRRCDAGEPGRGDATAARRACWRAVGVLPPPHRQRPRARRGRRAGDPAACLAQRGGAGGVARLGPVVAVHGGPQHRHRRVAHQAEQEGAADRRPGRAVRHRGPHRRAAVVLGRRRGADPALDRAPRRAPRVLLPRPVGGRRRPPARSAGGHRQVPHALRTACAAAVSRRSWGWRG